MEIEKLRRLEKFGRMLSRMIELNDPKLLECMKECGLPTEFQLLAKVELSNVSVLETPGGAQDKKRDGS